MSNCPVEDCKEVNGIKQTLKRWCSISITILVLVSGAAILTWANSRRVPALEEAFKVDHDKIIALEVRQQQIYKNTEDIKKWIGKQ